MKQLLIEPGLAKHSRAAGIEYIRLYQPVANAAFQ